MADKDPFASTPQYLTEAEAIELARLLARSFANRAKAKSPGGGPVVNLADWRKQKA